MTFFKRAVNFLSGKWDYLVGSDEEYSLEYRIFHSYVLVVSCIIIYAIPFNFLLGLTASGFLSVGMLIYQAAILYFSRFRGKTDICQIINALLFNLLFGINYFVNDGINGPTLLLCIICFLMLTASAPRKHFWWLLTLNIAVVSTMLLCGILKPSTIEHNYHSPQDQGFDMYSTYIICLILVYFGINFLRKNYFKENKLAHDKAGELADANAEKSKLFSIIAHDLGSPLSQISQYLQLLAKVDLDGQTRNSLELKLSDATNHTQIMLSNLLSWSTRQLEQAKKINIGPVDLLELVEKTALNIKHAALMKNIKVTIGLKPGILILADADYMQIVIRNILQNAIKFTPKNGSIDIAFKKDDQECILSIRDSGIGMATEQQDRIFSLKAESTYGTENEKGVGLGLILSRDLTLAQNGRIWFESAIAAGTVFYLAFQLA